MRRFLPLFMMLLLTLRGLLGNAMALDLGNLPHESALAPVATVQATAAAGIAAPHSTSAPSDDATAPSGHSAAPTSHHCAPLTTAPASDDPQHSFGCTACGICHSALSAPLALPPAYVRPAQATPASGPARFASATLVQAIKPPIA